MVQLYGGRLPLFLSMLSELCIPPLMEMNDKGTRSLANPNETRLSPPTISKRSFSAQSRGKSKRERTRASLIDATAELIASNGPDGATIAEITATAGLASGTFYNYFNDRAEIIAETALSIMEQIAAQINAAGQLEADPVVRLAAGTRRFLDISIEHPTWAWAVLRSVDYLPELRPKIYRYMGSTVQQGRESGDFVADTPFTLLILNAMLFAALRARLSGRAEADAGARVAEMQLLALGVDAARARAASNMPIKRIDLTLSPPAAKSAKKSTPQRTKPKNR